MPRTAVPETNCARQAWEHIEPKAYATRLGDSHRDPARTSARHVRKERPLAIMRALPSRRADPAEDFGASRTSSWRLHAPVFIPTMKNSVPHVQSPVSRTPFSVCPTNTNALRTKLMSALAVSVLLCLLPSPMPNQLMSWSSPWPDMTFITQERRALYFPSNPLRPIRCVLFRRLQLIAA